MSDEAAAPVVHDGNGNPVAPKLYKRVLIEFEDGSSTFIEGPDAEKWAAQVYAALRFAEKSGFEIEHVKWKRDG